MFDSSEGHVCHWKNDYILYFLPKLTRKCFMRPKEVRYPEI